MCDKSAKAVPATAAAVARKTAPFMMRERRRKIRSKSKECPLNE